MKYLTARDIADELGVSRARAYEIMRECTRLVSGRSVRVTPQAFHAWKERHTEQPCESLSTCAGTSGGVGSGIRTADVTSRLRQAAATARQRSSAGENSSDNPFTVPIKPRTIRRSKTPSSPDSMNDETPDERQAR